MHSLGIVHRDLKPENILFENKLKFADIKLIDFGLSRRFLNEDDLHSVVGSPFYVAPEVLDGNYDEKCDIWSIGIIAYCLLNGSPPFVSDKKAKIFEKIQKAKVTFPKEKFAYISNEAKEFILKALTKNPKKRPNAAQLLQEKWLEEEFNEEINPAKLNVKILKNIVNFHKPFRFTQRVVEIIIRTMPSKELKKFKDIFNALDTKKTGLISSDDFMNELNKLELNVNENKIKKVGTKRYDRYLKNGNKNSDLTYINFTSFIAAVINKDEIENKTRLYDAFNILDTNKTGYLTIFSIQKAFERTGKKTTINEIKEMFEEIGLEENESINFDEFCAIINKDL